MDEDELENDRYLRINLEFFKELKIRKNIVQ